jgi:uncharacterized OsmC-like protein
MAAQPVARTEVTVTRDSAGVFRARNARGAEITMSSSDPDSFSPIELLLAALAGCSAIDVDSITARRAEPTGFVARASGQKGKDTEGGNLLTDIDVAFDVTFPAGEDGEAARTRLPAALAQSHARLCTVSRTVEAGMPVRIRQDGSPQ